MKSKGKLVPAHGIKACVGSKSMAPVFLNWTTDGGEWAATGPGCLTRKQGPALPTE